MIIKNTLLDIADNSGGRKAMCIGLLNNKFSATVGDVIVVSIKAVTSKSKISRGKVCKAVVVRVKGPMRRLDGSVMRFSSNAVVLISENGEPLGTRVFGVVKKMPHGSFSKIMSLAVEVL